MLINLQNFIYFSTKIQQIIFLVDELSAISISISIASLGIYYLFFDSSDDYDQDGGNLVHTQIKN